MHKSAWKIQKSPAAIKSNPYLIAVLKFYMNAKVNFVILITYEKKFFFNQTNFYKPFSLMIIIKKQ